MSEYPPTRPDPPLPPIYNDNYFYPYGGLAPAVTTGGGGGGGGGGGLTFVANYTATDDAFLDIPISGSPQQIQIYCFNIFSNDGGGTTPFLFFDLNNEGAANVSTTQTNRCITNVTRLGASGNLYFCDTLCQNDRFRTGIPIPITNPLTSIRITSTSTATFLGDFYVYTL